jgi:hypothetical protein
MAQALKDPWLQDGLTYSPTAGRASTQEKPHSAPPSAPTAGLWTTTVSTSAGCTHTTACQWRTTVVSVALDKHDLQCPGVEQGVLRVNDECKHDAFGIRPHIRGNPRWVHDEV